MQQATPDSESRRYAKEEASRTASTPGPSDTTSRQLDELFDKYYPLGTVKPKDDIDADKAALMTRMMEHRRNKFKSEVAVLIEEAEQEARIDELLFLTNHADPLILDRKWIANRIASIKALERSK